VSDDTRKTANARQRTPASATRKTPRGTAARRRPAAAPAALGPPSLQQDMPPTARRLLQAARRLLERSGFRALSVQAIANEAGENKALIRYYFGDKNGLLVALVDWLMYDYLWEVWQRLAQLSRGHDGLDLLMDGAAAGMLADSTSYRAYFDLLPHVLRDPGMAGQLSELLKAYRDLNVRGFWGDRGDPPAVIEDLAALTVAMTDGLAIQMLADPDKVDVPRALALWKTFVEQTVAGAERSALSQGGRRREGRSEG
jgi:AcrR family transcriptional regulator